MNAVTTLWPLQDAIVMLAGALGVAAWNEGDQKLGSCQVPTAHHAHASTWMGPR